MIQDIYPHIFNNTYIPGLESNDESLIIHFDGNGSILCKDEGKPFPRLFEFDNKPQKLTYLFSMDDDCVFLAEDEVVDKPSDSGYMRIRDFRKRENTPKKSVFEVFTAKQLAGWYKNNTYCGRCGKLTRRSTVERALTCECGNVIYPRVVPAVIVAVLKRAENRDDDEIVLTKYAGRDAIPYYALVAGFTEIGETFEETVAREVKEEIGLNVKKITYYKSQPWGVADDLLAGFFCEVDGDSNIKRDELELAVAQWMRREDVVLQPDQLSLTNEMMILFKESGEPFL
ncbi:MAG: NUDIX domain-containing protein [Saccharofermentans sp.]|nr:NUDIX domain-containing protein [Saccharofermentans sp.]